MLTIDYDIVKAFEAIEEQLIASMIRNLKKHKAEEIAEGFEWEMWQSVQIRELERYRRENQTRFLTEGEKIRAAIEQLLRGEARKAEKLTAEKIEGFIKSGKFRAAKIDLEWFRLNEGRLNALIEATERDFQMAQVSILRQAEDAYRRTIFNAQVYSATGATYEQAVDIATKDFLRAGINCVVYKNGSRHTVPEYTRMALRTGQKRAYLMGQGNALDRYGIHTVRVNTRTHACPKCSKWLNRVLVDDVYAGGTAEEARQAGVPLLSEAIREGFLHPNCKDVYSLYMPGISRPAKEWTEEELKVITDQYNADAELNRAETMAESYNRMAKYSLDQTNQQNYRTRADNWRQRAEEIRNGNRPQQ